jgi:hypothetical protein
MLHSLFCYVMEVFCSQEYVGSSKCHQSSLVEVLNFDIISV